MEASDVRRLQPINLPVISYRTQGKAADSSVQEEFRLPPGASLPSLVVGISTLLDAACRGLMEDSAALQAARVRTDCPATAGLMHAC